MTLVREGTSKSGSEVMKYDVIIVGAGPSGLFAARELAAAGKRVAILDKGKRIEDRHCPLKEGKSDTCLHCKPCNAVSYTHLDVYKRQASASPRGNWRPPPGSGGTSR